MNEAETVMLARYVRALCPQQKFDEFTADAWYDVLAPYSLDEARAAVTRHIKAGNAFIAVGEIVAEIRKARNDRLDRHTEAEPPAGDSGDDTYKAALLAERRAIADGHMEPRPVPALPPGRTDEQPTTGRARAILEASGRHVPSVREGIVNVFAVPCPRCLAPAGRNCTSSRDSRRRRVDPHPARLEDARRAASGLPPVDEAEVHDEVQRRLAASRAALAALPPGTVIEAPAGPNPEEQTAS
ncbi:MULTISPECIES: zinc finger domain-containing protein [Streptomyces]|uniref:zinc finger domain-containing protein n=1 Tax=Streptomyces TaxID=1883 RepID=UPI00345B972B